MSDADPDRLLDLATALAESAASLLVDGLARQRAEVGTKSTSTDLVTEMDRASESLIVDGIRRARPHDGLLGEEGAVRHGSSGVRWVIDPLDGTTNYVYGLPGFAVSIAVEDEEGALAGVVADPLHGDVFTATRDGGARRNGRPVRVSGHDGHLGTALVATGFSYESGRRARQAAVLAEVLPRVRDIRRFGAAAVDLCSVACGRVDAYYEKGLQRWDVAAGELIAREAGARTGDLDGGPAGRHFTLAASPELFEGLRALLAASGAADA